MLEIPLTQLYRHLIGQSKPILPFEMIKSSEEEGPSLIGKFLTNPGTYMGFLGMIFILQAWTSIALRDFDADLPHQGTGPIPQLHHNMPLWMMM